MFYYTYYNEYVWLFSSLNVCIVYLPCVRWSKIECEKVPSRSGVKY